MTILLHGSLIFLAQVLQAHSYVYLIKVYHTLLYDSLKNKKIMCAELDVYDSTKESAN